MFGEENSTIMRFLPFDASLGFLRPRYGFNPKDFPCVMIFGMRICASLSTLKKNCRKVPKTVGFWTRGDSGN